MKNRVLYMIAVAAGVLAACTKNEDVISENGDGIVDTVSGFTFTAVMENTGVGSKALLGTNDSGKPQTFWEDGDHITVFSQGDGDSGSMAGYDFSTSLGENSVSAVFSLAGDFTSGNMLAIYPTRGANRDINFTGSGDIYKIAQVDIPQSQTLVANNFDRSAAVMTAYATSGSKTLSFKNAVALLKFRVSDADVKKGRIVVGPVPASSDPIPQNDAISGRFRADLSTSSPYYPTLTRYNNEVYNYIDFTIDGSTPLSTETDYYIAVRPCSLTKGLRVYLDGYLAGITPVDNITLERNIIYDLGTLTKSGVEGVMKLDFDFVSAPPTGEGAAWPTSGTPKLANGGEARDYVLDETTYTFWLSDPIDASASQIFWSPTNKQLTFNSAYRYLGIPRISGYKPVAVVGIRNYGGALPKFEFVNTIKTGAVHPTGDEIISVSQEWTDKNTPYTYDLFDTEDLSSTSNWYYLYGRAKGSVGHLTLYYAPI